MLNSSVDRQQFEPNLSTLVEKFKRHHADYKRSDYSEAQARLDFISPLFEALGWDVRNAAGLGPKEREVVVEQGQTTGRPDYNFRLDGRTVFFVEAKAPHVPIDRADVIMQAKSYAWSSHEVFISAVTDFEEFRLYDATVKPDRRHPDVGLIFHYQYSDYLEPETMDDLWLLSREAVAGGSIDRLLSMSGVTARQKLPVDQAFLDDLTGWRERLAKAVYKADPDFDVADLNSVVQVFLDRLIFIRIAEDRGILPLRGLEDIHRAWEHSGKRRPLTPDLNALFHEVNQSLNGEIFKPHLCEQVNWDADSALVAGIIDGLYFPKCPYRFDALGVEILGSIYERYLGKTIRVTATRAVVEDKPEVRKAGGVYYTPKYIVDYIVENTVGKLIEGKTPKQIAKLRILDPACGSGSFLLGAYQKLLDYHEFYYARRTTKRAKGGGSQPVLIGEGDSGGFRLSLEEKAAILRNNIYGVDIDPQAVEITMLSLYIKMLEGERGAIKGAGVLPPLRNNIKCGNSLINHDVASQPEMFGEFSADELHRLNPFDWESKSEGFGKILARGGFDVVIGNPPWGADLGNVELKHVRQHHSRVIARMIDTYIFFIDQALLLTKQGKPIGFIVPSTILNQVDAKPIRLLLIERGLSVLISLGRNIFGTKVLNTSTVFVSSDRKNRDGFIFADLSPIDLSDRQDAIVTISSKSWRDWRKLVRSDPHLTFFVGKTDHAAILKRLRGLHGSLKDVLEGQIQRGVSPDVVSAHVISFNDAKLENLERAVLRSSVSGSQIKRYSEWHSDQYILYLTRSTLIRDFPRAFKYLEGFKRLNTCKEAAAGKHPWWSLHRPRDPAIFESPKFIGLTTSKSIELIYDADSSIYVTDAMYVFALRPEFDPWACIAVLQSKLFLFLYGIANQGQSRVIPQVKASKLEILPFPAFKSSDILPTKLNQLARWMLALNKQKAASKSEAARERIQREINMTDERIDALVFELYGLTPDEIAVVEEQK